MKVININSYFLQSLFVFGAVGCTSTAPTPTQTTLNSVESGREISAEQKFTVPFENLDIGLTLKPGKTFLAFMQEELKPSIDSQYAEIKRVQSRFPKQYSTWQKELIKTGTGVAVRIDENNYFFNVAYTDTPTEDEVQSRKKDEDSDENDAKSGRSYGIGPTNRQSDPSYPFYLRELKAYLRNEPQNTEKFYRALVLMLTDCDTSGWATLSEEGQIVATDYLAIYAAELYRHIVMDLKPRSHPWEIDMSGITFIAPFSVKTGKIVRDGSLVSEDILGWIGRNENTGSSGVGFTRGDRQILSSEITRFLKNGDSAEHVKAVNAAIGERDGDDVIQGFFEFLNSRDQRGARLNRNQIRALSESLPKLIGASHADAQAMEENIFQ